LQRGKLSRENWESWGKYRENWENSGKIKNISKNLGDHSVRIVEFQSRMQYTTIATKILN
jgi:hypothetical protein